MVEQRLIDYVQKTLSAGYSVARVKNALLKKGWKPEDVDEAVNIISKNKSSKKIQSNEIIGTNTFQKKVISPKFIKQPSYTKTIQSTQSKASDNFQVSKDVPVVTYPKDEEISLKKENNFEKEDNKKQKDQKKNLFKGFNFKNIKENKNEDKKENNFEKEDNKKQKIKKDVEEKISSGKDVSQKDGLKGLKITLTILIILFLVVLGFGIWYFFFYNGGSFFGLN